MFPQSLRMVISESWKRLVIAIHLVPANLAFVTEIADSAGFKGDPIPRF